MNNISLCIDTFHLQIHKIEKKKNYIILYGKDKKYLLKEKSINKEIYEYLKTIEYPYFVPIINNEMDPYTLSIYVDEVTNDDILKGKKIIEALLYIHNKSIYEETLTENEKKGIYEKIKKVLEEKERYYEELQNYIEEFSFPRVDYYYLINNISLFYKSIWTSRSFLEKWYEENPSIMMKAMTIQNVSLDNFVFSSTSYFIDINSCLEDYRIYDLVNFYREDALKTSLSSLLKKYNSQSPLTSSEQTLLNCLISIPDTIPFTNHIYQNTVKIKNSLDKIDKTFILVSEKNKEDEKTNKEKLEEENNNIDLSSNKH